MYITDVSIVLFLCGIFVGIVFLRISTFVFALLPIVVGVVFSFFCVGAGGVLFSYVLTSGAGM